MKMYKGFDKDLKCRGFQFEVGKEYEETGAALCKKGFHACELPHDTFSYYVPGQSRFCEVDLEPTDEIGEDDSKRCGNRIKILAEVSVFDLCKLSVNAFFERFGFKDKIASADTNVAGDNGAANAGDMGAANAGDYGAANAGYMGAANAGDYGAANAGDRGAANAGDRGAANAGHRGAAISRCDGKSSVGKEGVAVSFGGMAKGKENSVLVLIEMDDDGNILHQKALFVGVDAKPDVWYTLKDGKVTECE